VVTDVPYFGAIVDHGWTFDDLEGEFLRGISQRVTTTVLHLGRNNNECHIVIKSKTYEYSWNDNWYIAEVNNGVVDDRPSNYKAIGEEVEEVSSADYETNTPFIQADKEKWTEAVGDGVWGPKEGENYLLFTIRTQSKVIDFGTQYVNCHYPKVLWELQEYDSYEPKFHKAEGEELNT
jgi:hypothetical protein